MATHKGSEGFVNVGANTIAEIRGWTIEQTADTLDDTTMGDTAKTYLASLTDFTGSVDCLWDETDTTGQEAMTIGASITINLYPEGDDTGDKYYTGTVLITGISRNATHDGLIEASYSFQGTGGLTVATVGS